MKQTEIDRFWAKVRRGADAECWEWTGTKTQRGYGQAYAGGRMWAAHRLSWVLHNGPIPTGMLMCHRCDNPLCVNPSHLFLGTHKDNMADMKAKGRAVHPIADMLAARTACLNGHPYTADNTYARPDGGRDCRTCIRERVRKYDARMRAEKRDRERSA